MGDGSMPTSSCMETYMVSGKEDDGKEICDNKYQKT